MLTTIGSIHCVNLAQGIKEPIIYYQQNPDKRFVNAVKQGFHDIRKFNGQPQGMYGGAEALHGNHHTQGSELCSAVELMFSLETMLERSEARGLGKECCSTGRSRWTRYQ